MTLGMRTKFVDWLKLNESIWAEFCDLASLMRGRGRTNWSARAILHVLRWHRALKDPTDNVYKINNNWSPEMARLYNHINGVEFFRNRESP